MTQVVEAPRVDPFRIVREYCTCPNPACKMVWTHPERNVRQASDWVTERYGRAPYQCPECRQWSRQRVKVGFWDRMAGRWREIIPDPQLTTNQTIVSSEGRDR